MAEFNVFDYGKSALAGEAIKGARSRNLLAQNQVERIPQMNRAQDQTLRANEMKLTDAEIQRAVDALSRGFGIVANAPDPKAAATQWVTSPQFQSSAQILGIPADQFTVDDTDDPNELRRSAQDYVYALTGQTRLTNTDIPANVRSAEYYAGLPETGSGLTRETYQQAVRAPSITTIAGVPTQANAPEGPRPLSTLADETSAAQQLAGATRAGQEEATTAAIPERSYLEAQIEDYQQAPARLQASQDIVQQVQQLEPVFDRVLENAGAWTVGFGSVAKPPGSPAANMEADLNTLGANAAFDRLQQMRDSSPTGGALGQVSERELALLQSAVAAIAQSQSPEQFRQNVLRLRENYKRIDALARQAQRVDRLKAQVNALRQRPETPETAGRIQNLQNQIYAIEDELWESIDETGVAPSGDQAAPTSGWGKVTVVE